MGRYSVGRTERSSREQAAGSLQPRGDRQAPTGFCSTSTALHIVSSEPSPWPPERVMRSTISLPNGLGRARTTSTRRKSCRVCEGRRARSAGTNVECRRSHHLYRNGNKISVHGVHGKGIDMAEPARVSKTTAGKPDPDIV